MPKETLTAKQLDDAYNSYFGYNAKGKINYEHRYSSWDICYDYFQNNFFKEPTPSSLREAAFYLSFYLSSWGMLRNSELLNFGIKKYESLASSLHSVTRNSLACVISYEEIKLILQELGVSATNTLVTKIMLGVYGNVPAIDRFFKKTSSLYCVGIGHKDNSGEKISKKLEKIFSTKIDDGRTIEKFIKDLNSPLPDAKILDSIFFSIGKNSKDPTTTTQKLTIINS